MVKHAVWLIECGSLITVSRVRAAGAGARGDFSAVFNNVLRVRTRHSRQPGQNARLSTLDFITEYWCIPASMLPMSQAAKSLERRMCWVKRHFNVIPLIEAVERLQAASFPRALWPSLSTTVTRTTSTFPCSNSEEVRMPVMFFIFHRLSLWWSHV